MFPQFLLCELLCRVAGSPPPSCSSSIPRSRPCPCGLLCLCAKIPVTKASLHFCPSCNRILSSPSLHLGPKWPLRQHSRLFQLNLPVQGVLHQMMYLKFIIQLQTAYVVALIWNTSRTDFPNYF